MDRTVISINLTPEQVDQVSHYEYEKDMQRDVTELFLDQSLSNGQRDERATQLFVKSCMFEIRGVELFVEELASNDAVLINDLENNRVFIKHPAGYVNIDLRFISPPQWQTYFSYLKHTDKIPTELSEIEETIVEAETEAKKAFAAV